MAGRRVLITGVGSVIGGSRARRLERDPEVEHVVGLDDRPPCVSLERTEVIEADIRNPVIGRLIPQTRVDTVVHKQIVRRPGPGMSVRQMHDVNVIGSLQLLAACEKAETIRAIVIRGSAGIYGAEPGAPQFFTEEMTRLYPLRTRFQRDVAEIENYFETSRAAGPTSSARCSATSPASARRSTPRSPATSRCRSCRPTWASTRGFRSCMSRMASTRWSRRCGDRSGER